MACHGFIFKTAVRRALALLLVAVSFVSIARASRVRLLNLEEMTQRAARILSGRCLEVRVEHDPSIDIDVTLVRIAVDRTVKGHHDRTITVRVADATRPGASGTEVVGMPTFTAGEEVVLFLYGESRAGLTSPVGFGQGKFTVLTDKKGHRYALNAHENRTLFSGLSPGATKALAASAREWGTGHGIPPDVLLDMARTLGK
jgi:hypothetical protein